jgi:hypothetical protein
MDSRRPIRGAKAMNVHPLNGGYNRPYVKLDRITQIPSPFHHNQNRPSPYSRSASDFSLFIFQVGRVILEVGCLIFTKHVASAFAMVFGHVNFSMLNS